MQYLLPSLGNKLPGCHVPHHGLGIVDLVVGLVPLDVLEQLFESRQEENAHEGDDGDEPAGGRDVRDLLHQPDGQEKDVGVPERRKLL